MPGPRTQRMQDTVESWRMSGEALSRQTRHFGGSSPSPAGETSVWLKLKSVDANGVYTVRRVSHSWNTGTKEVDVVELGESDEFGYEINGWKVVPDVSGGVNHIVRAWPSRDSAGDPIWAFAMTMPPMTAADDFKVISVDDNDKLLVDYVRAHA